MLRIDAADLKKHMAELTRALAHVCDLRQKGRLVTQVSPDDSAPLAVGVGAFGVVPASATTIVTSDLGGQEHIVALATTSSNERYWIGLHELWSPRGRRRLDFDSCGLRIYMGATGEEAVQILRLEWVAPKTEPDGTVRFDGEHAGHPHWHVDRAALVGSADYLRSLDALTAPSATVGAVETFGPGVEEPETPPNLVHDCSWLLRVHLAAQASWMNSRWDGATSPGPHQIEPRSLKMLTTWLTGALYYISSEVRAHGI